MIRFPLLLLAASMFTFPAAAQVTGEDPIAFETFDRRSADAFAGTFSVPENRADPESRMITLHYVRFPATTDTPGAPIVYLAGGPGGSGINTAKGARFDLFMELRKFGDVIAFDQRGTGASSDIPRCTSQVTIPASQPADEAQLTAYYRRATDECATFWRSEGVDLAGYTTAENAADLDALRRHLRAEKISLWGISYGTHLALAAMRQMDGRLDRVILASTEGLAQTVKLPASSDAYFDRLQTAIDGVPAAKAIYPDIVDLIRRVNVRLRDHPNMLHLPQKDGSHMEAILDMGAMQRIGSAMIADPQGAAMLLALYRAIDAGNYDPITMVVGGYFQPNNPITLDAMSLVMDLASGIDDDRLTLVDDQAKTALLGRYLNFPMPQLFGAIAGVDLGPDFRASPKSDVPTLLLTGTLDGRTYPEEHAEAIACLTQVDRVTVVNAGHNLFMVSPEVTQIIAAWMAGGEVDGTEITIGLPDFENPMP